MVNIPIASAFDVDGFSQYLREKVDPNIFDWDRRDFFPFEVFRGFHAYGVLAAGLPETLGGGGRKMIDLMKIVETLSYHSSGLTASWLANLLAQTAISRFARDSVAEKTIKQHLAEQSIFSFCATERESGFDIQNLATIARSDGAHFRISGKKHYITNVNYASHYVVFAKIETVPGIKEPGVSAFLVPANLPGITRGEKLEKLGQCESDTGQIIFDDVCIPAENILGAAGGALAIIHCALSRTKTLLSAAAVGICRRAEDEAVDYLTRTQRYGEPLLARREIQGVLSRERARSDAAWLLGCRAAAVWDEKETAIYESSVAKLFSSDTAVSFVNEALELTGGTGYMRQSFLSKLLRDAKVLEIYEGSTLVLQALMGRELYAPRLKPRAGGSKR